MSDTVYGIALIGAGNIARIHARAIAEIPNARLVAVYDIVEPACRALAQEAGDVDWTCVLDEILTRRDVDVVSICTPSGTHADLGMRAALAGKHLIVEKPIDITLERADQLIGIAREEGVKLAGIFPYRFMQGAQLTKAAIEQGRLGRLVLVDAYVKWYRSQAYYHGWHGTRELDGGGALINQSIHNIDLVQWLAGPATSVFAQTATLAHEVETEDTASAVLTFENGALGVIQGATSCWPGDPARAEFHGTEGTIVLEEGRITSWQMVDASPEETRAMTALEDQEGHTFDDPTAVSHIPHRMQIQDLLDAIREDREPRVPGTEARKALEIIRAAYLSSRRGQVIHLPLIDPEA